MCGHVATLPPMAMTSTFLDKAHPPLVGKSPAGPPRQHHAIPQSSSTSDPRLPLEIPKGLCSGIMANHKVISPPKVWDLDWSSSAPTLPARIKLNPLKKTPARASLPFFLHNVQHWIQNLNDLWPLSVSNAPLLIQRFLPSKQIWMSLTTRHPSTAWSEPRHSLSQAYWVTALCVVSASAFAPLQSVLNLATATEMLFKNQDCDHMPCSSLQHIPSTFILVLRIQCPQSALDHQLQEEPRSQYNGF